MITGFFRTVFTPHLMELQQKKGIPLPEVPQIME
jgi:hypothetical protein